MQFNLKQTNETTDTNWVRYYNEFNEEGVFEITPTKMIWHDENKSFLIIDEENKTATSVYCEHHENSQFTDSMPDGVRLANAMGRSFAISGEINAPDLVETANKNIGFTIKVEKTEKGRLWTVYRLD